RFHRGTLDRDNRYFGPFPGAGAVREGIALLQKVFMLRVCENSVFANRSRPCMLYQIQRCTAPCVGHIGEADYRADVESATLFLQGKTDAVLAQLQQQMEAASAALEFERAARERDRRRRRRGCERVGAWPDGGQRRDGARWPPHRRPHVLSAARRRRGDRG